MSELISVIIPVYNAEKYISCCIQNILSQSYSNLEIIIVDDGSIDSSYEVIKTYTIVDPRIKLYKKENGGASSARNYGLDHALGEYIVFVDIDDGVSPNYIENLYLAAKCNDFDIVQCDYRTVDTLVVDTGAPFNSADVIQISKYQALNERKYKVSIWGKIYKRKLFEEFRFRENIIYEDDDSYYILIYNSSKLALLKETLYYYYLSQNSVMRNHEHTRRIDFLDIYERRISFFQEKNEEVLLQGSYERYCIVLMLFYAKCISDSMNTNDLRVIIDTFNFNYKKLKINNVVFPRDRILLQMFHYFPRFTGLLLSKTRK